MAAQGLDELSPVYESCTEQAENSLGTVFLASPLKCALHPIIPTMMAYPPARDKPKLRVNLRVCSDFSVVPAFLLRHT